MTNADRDAARRMLEDVVKRLGAAPKAAIDAADLYEGSASAKHWFATRHLEAAVSEATNAIRVIIDGYLTPGAKQ